MKKYLKDKLVLLVLLLINSLFMILVINILYGVDYEISLYPIFISWLLLFIYFAYDYYKYRKKTKILENFQKDLDYDLKDEKDYFTYMENKILDLASKLQKENIRIFDKKEFELQSTIDYYTMWIHQIKTPIASLSFLIENLEDKNKKKLEIELFKIEQYVDLLLSYIRLDDKNNDIEAEQVLMKEVVNKILKKYANLFISKSINLDYQKLDIIYISDKKWLEFIVEQIISNAIKYSKNKGKIKIYQENEALVIEDEGMGISKDNLPRIFEKSFTGFNGRKDKQSSGLGLYLSKKAADKISCQLEIESEMNVGTKVKIKAVKDNVL
ncbi:MULTISPECIES: HAMP domain-containing sensor histidine kinase [unclassified Gemella]|uniref:sensor histidine kinase n=1 Tax=unclassified Gemella TaxID=2624949 RepID=UPI0015D0215D|nr:MULTISPECIES: sensor histidine kinase [unclassified Gemella]MBF0710389.1 sensor histidine kinase [Gemella sp. GL1.1]NYS27733.1 sensor histidine kinase [Gemella sp. GL1]